MNENIKVLDDYGFTWNNEKHCYQQGKKGPVVSREAVDQIESSVFRYKIGSLIKAFYQNERDF